MHHELFLILSLVFKPCGLLKIPIRQIPLSSRSFNFLQRLHLQPGLSICLLFFSSSCVTFMWSSRVIIMCLLYACFVLVLLFYVHTDPWPFEGTWWSACNVMPLFRSSVARNQSPGQKRKIDIPLPESWILNPEAMNPDLESIIKQTKHCIKSPFSQENIFTGFDYLKQRRGH